MPQMTISDIQTAANKMAGDRHAAPASALNKLLDGIDSASKEADAWGRAANINQLRQVITLLEQSVIPKQKERELLLHNVNALKRRLDVAQQRHPMPAKPIQPMPVGPYAPTTNPNLPHPRGVWSGEGALKTLLGLVGTAVAIKYGGTWLQPEINALPVITGISAYRTLAVAGGIASWRMFKKQRAVKDALIDARDEIENDDRQAIRAYQKKEEAHNAAKGYALGIALASATTFIAPHLLDQYIGTSSPLPSVPTAVAGLLGGNQVIVTKDTDFEYFGTDGIYNHKTLPKGNHLTVRNPGNIKVEVMDDHGLTGFVERKNIARLGKDGKPTLTEPVEKKTSGIASPLTSPKVKHSTDKAAPQDAQVPSPATQKKVSQDKKNKSWDVGRVPKELRASIQKGFAESRKEGNVLEQYMKAETAKMAQPMKEQEQRMKNAPPKDIPVGTAIVTKEHAAFQYYGPDGKIKIATVDAGMHATVINGKRNMPLWYAVKADFNGHETTGYLQTKDVQKDTGIVTSTPSMRTPLTNWVHKLTGKELSF